MAAGISIGTGVVFVVSKTIPEHTYQLHDFIYCLSGGAFFGSLYLVFAIYQNRQVRMERMMRALSARKKHTEELLELSRYRLLAAQIQPHFLFNVLSNLHALVTHDPPRAERLLVSLTEYLNNIIYHTRQPAVPLADELATVETYLSIQNERLQRLTYRINVPENIHDIPVPPLSLLTLAENSIKHGISKRTGAGIINITGGKNDDTLWIQIEDNGVGLNATNATTPRPQKHAAENNHGIGLANVRERLRSLHGDNCDLDLRPGKTGGCIARITIPHAEPPEAVPMAP